MHLNNIIEVLFDLATQKTNFLAINNDEVLQYFHENYSSTIEKEILRINLDILDNKKQSSNDSLLLSKLLFETTKVLNDKNLLQFFNSCSFSENDSKFLQEALNNKEQDDSILNLLQNLIKNQSFDVLREYRESPKARKDIKKQINNNNISSSILNPFLMLLNDRNVPSLRMELWQKFEMYFESGWGFNDLTNNDSNSPLVSKMQELIKIINEGHNELNTHEGVGKELLTLLSERISELGVPILIKMEKNPINNSNIPVAEILENKEEYKHSFLSKNTMRSGFVDWAIPNFSNPTHLHCSIATSDETCSIENSEAFRYEYALRELTKDNDRNKGFHKMLLSFYSTSTFYDEYDADDGWNDSKHKEIGQEFLTRYNVHKEQRRLLNIIPFFAMTHKISSNLKTGIYSPEQLMTYNFKILGAKSMIEDQPYELEEIFKRCINVILKVFSQDKKNDYYNDGKSLNMLNQLYNLLITSKDEFFESKKIFNLLTNEETIQSLNNILKKIPENQNNEKQVNKNDFKTLIQSLKYIGNIGFNNFKIEQNENRNEYLKDLEELKKLNKLSDLLIYIDNLNDKITLKKNDIISTDNFEDFLQKSKKEQKLFTQNLLINFCDNISYGKRDLIEIYRKNKIIDNYYYANYPSSNYYYYKRVKEFKNDYQEKEAFLDSWKNNKLYIYSDTIVKMCHFYIKYINEDNFNEFQLPLNTANEYASAKKFNTYVELSNPDKILQIKSDNAQKLKEIDNITDEKFVLINYIENNYSESSVKKIIEKFELNEKLHSEFKFTNIKNNQPVELKTIKKIV